MRILFGLLFTGILVFSCNSGDKIPDVSNIKIELSTQRFEKDLFTLDTVNFAASLDQLIAKYPSFGENFLSTILGADPKWSIDTTAAYVKLFINQHRNIYDTVIQVFKDFSPYEAEIKKGLQFVKYYFPDSGA